MCSSNVPMRQQHSTARNRKNQPATSMRSDEASTRAQYSILYITRSARPIRGGCLNTCMCGSFSSVRACGSSSSRMPMRTNLIFSYLRVYVVYHTSLTRTYRTATTTKWGPSSSFHKHFSTSLYAGHDLWTRVHMLTIFIWRTWGACVLTCRFFLSSFFRSFFFVGSSVARSIDARAHWCGLKYCRSVCECLSMLYAWNFLADEYEHRCVFQDCALHAIMPMTLYKVVVDVKPKNTHWNTNLAYAL